MAYFCIIDGLWTVQHVIYKFRHYTDTFNAVWGDVAWALALYWMQPALCLTKVIKNATNFPNELFEYQKKKNKKLMCNMLWLWSQPLFLKMCAPDIIFPSVYCITTIWVYFYPIDTSSEYGHAIRISPTAWKNRKCGNSKTVPTVTGVKTVCCYGYVQSSGCKYAS